MCRSASPSSPSSSSYSACSSSPAFAEPSLFVSRLPLPPHPYLYSQRQLTVLFSFPRLKARQYASTHTHTHSHTHAHSRTHLCVVHTGRRNGPTDRSPAEKGERESAGGANTANDRGAHTHIHTPRKTIVPSARVTFN